MDDGGARFAIAGAFATDGGGNINSGQADFNDNGTINFGSGLNSPVGFTGTYTAPSASNGRFATTITLPGPTLVHLALYVVSAGEFFYIGTDALTSTTSLYGGSIAQQSGRPYGNLSTTGTHVFYRMGQSGSSAHALVGFNHPDGNGNYTATYDLNDAGVYSAGTLAGTYSVAANGRITSTGGQARVFYIADESAGGGFGLSADNVVGFGRSQLQAAGPFSNASLSGNYIASSVAPVTSSKSVESDAATADGSGRITVPSYTTKSVSVIDSSVLNPQVDYVMSSSGRAPGLESTIYLISPSKAVLVQVGPDSEPSISLIDQCNQGIHSPGAGFTLPDCSYSGQCGGALSTPSKQNRFWFNACFFLRVRESERIVLGAE